MGDTLKSIFFLFVIMALGSNYLFAAEPQKNTNYYITGGAYLSGNIYSSNFKELPGYPNCCTNFSSAFGISPSLYIGGEYKFDDMLWGLGLRYSFRLLYSDLSANYSQDEFIGYNIHGNSYEKIISNYSLKPSIKTIGTEQLIAIYPPFGFPLSFLAGFGLNFPIQAKVAQIEKLKSPANINFSETGLRSRNSLSGDLVDKSAALFSLTLGARYSAYQSNNFEIVPELVFNYGLNDVVQNTDWKASSLKLGVALHYNIPESKPEIIVPPQKPPMPKPQLPELKEIDYVQRILYHDVYFEDGRELPIPLVRDRIVDYTRHLPILFFKKGTAEFNNTLNPLTAIGEDLNIEESIFKFLNRAEDEIICTIGTSSDESDEVFVKRKNKIIEVLKSSGNDDLGNMQFVHLRSTDKKDRSELQEESRFANFSKKSGEMLSINYYKSISESIRSTNKNVLFFKTEIEKNIKIRQFSLKALIDGKEVYSTRDTNGRLNVIDEYYLTEDLKQSTLKVETSLTTEDGMQLDKETKYLITPAIVSENRIVNPENGKEQIVLGLFDFDDSVFISVDYKMLEKIEFASRNGKRIKLIPFTDNMGTKAYNEALALKRAKVAAELLRMTDSDYEIEMPTGYLFDNSSPSGRVLNRCVVVIIE